MLVSGVALSGAAAFGTKRILPLRGSILSSLRRSVLLRQLKGTPWRLCLQLPVEIGVLLPRINIAAGQSCRDAVQRLGLLDARG